MPTYYYAQDGTAANKAAATSGTYPGGCMSVPIAKTESYSPGDFVLASDQGGDMQIDGSSMSASSDGTSGNEVTYGAKAGETPVFTGKVDLTSATYKWTESLAKSGEWHVELAGGGDPGLTDTHLLLLNGSPAVESNGEVSDPPDLGNLNDHEWGYEDNDSLGYDTVYFRDDSGDPDASGVLLEFPQTGCFSVYLREHVIVDGITVKHGYNQNGSLWVGTSTNVLVQNCTAEYNGSSGIMIKSGSTHCTVDSCEASYNGAHNIGVGGGSYNVLSNSVVHHCRTTGFSGSSPFDGYGLKFITVTNGKIFGNEVYENQLQGINFDWSDGIGVEDCEIYENLVYDNWSTGILLELHSDRNLIYGNRCFDNNSLGKGSAWEIGVVQSCHDNAIFNNICYKTKVNDADYQYNLITAIQYSEGDGCTGTLVYNNMLDGGGYSTRGIQLVQHDTPKDCQIFNNIIVGLTSIGYGWQVSGTDLTGFDADNNCMLRAGAPSYIVHYDGTQYTLAGIQGHDPPFEEDGLNEDPKFTDAVTFDFSLASDSPCIDVGKDLGEPYNQALLPASTWPDGVVTGSQEDY